MEHRDPDQFGGRFLVDFSGAELQDTGKMQGRYPIVYSQKQETEMASLDQETKLMRAMNEIRAYSPKNMTTAEREMFVAMCENIFRKHGITPEFYQQHLRFLGTPQTLRR